MSKNKHRRLKVQGDSLTQPVRIRTNAERIMEWVLYGDPRGKEAVGTLFSVCKEPNCPFI